MSGLEALAMGASLLSTAVGAVGAIQQGQAAKENANFQAAQMERQADNELALSTRKAQEETRKKDALLSRQTAIAAASGGGVSNPTILSLLGETEARGDYNARSQIYSGQQQSEGLNLQAKGTRASGKAAATGGYLKGAGTLVSGIGSAFKAYG